MKVLELPGRLDPDEYIQQNGVDAYRKQLDEAPSYFHWLAARAKQRFDMRTGEGRMDAFKFMLPAIQQVNDPMERGVIATEIAEFLNVDRDVIRENSRRMQGPRPIQKTRDVSSSVPSNEKLLLSCLLLSEDARNVIKEYLARTGILDLLQLRSVFEAVLALDAEGIPFSLEALSSRLEPSVQRIVSELSFSDGVTEENVLPLTLQRLEAFEAKALEAQRDTLRRRIRELEERGELTEALRLANELDRTRSASSGP